MPLDIRDILNKSREVEVEFDGEFFTVEYGPHLMDAPHWTRMFEIFEMEPREQLKHVDDMRAMIAHIVRGWSIVDGGSPLPVDEDTLKMFPAQMTMAVFWSVLGDYMTPKNGNSSSTASNSKAASARSRRGTA